MYTVYIMYVCTAYMSVTLMHTGSTCMSSESYNTDSHSGFPSICTCHPLMYIYLQLCTRIHVHVHSMGLCLTEQMYCHLRNDGMPVSAYSVTLSPSRWLHPPPQDREGGCRNRRCMYIYMYNVQYKFTYCISESR